MPASVLCARTTTENKTHLLPFGPLGLVEEAEML